MTFEVRTKRRDGYGDEAVFGVYGSLAEAEKVADYLNAGEYRVRIAPVVSDVGRLAVEAGCR